jgi:hypothetical protein
VIKGQGKGKREEDIDRSVFLWHIKNALKVCSLPLFLMGSSWGRRSPKRRG